MRMVFQICFTVGIGITVMSFFMGNLLQAAGIKGLKLDLGLLKNSVFLPVRPVLTELFIVVFGGIGWIILDVHSSLPQAFILLIAVIAGLFIIAAVYHFVIKTLKTAQNSGSPNAEELVGQKATVSEVIYSGGAGKIRYVMNESTFISPARATNGEEIAEGKEVSIRWIEDSIFYVASPDNVRS